jgi:hypothetical protein
MGWRIGLKLLNGVGDGSDGEAVSAQALWIAAAACALAAIASGLAEWARHRRRNLDRVGWVPWQLVTMLAIFGTIILAALAVHA